MEEPRTLQVFSAGETKFAVFADEVLTIAEWREPAVLPYAPLSVLGVVSIQGRMLTVLDLSQLLEVQPRKKGPSHILAFRGDEQLALAIDGPGETIQLGETDGNFATATEVNGELIASAFNHHGDEIKILNIKTLFATAIQGRERRRRRF
jgi:chemotaxis signal transduction protein